MTGRAQLELRRTLSSLAYSASLGYVYGAWNCATRVELLPAAAVVVTAAMYTVWLCAKIDRMDRRFLDALRAAGVIGEERGGKQ